MSGDMSLELIVVPVSDVDRAKTFYESAAGFRLDVDHQAGSFRVVQLTPPGSRCSIALMPNDSAGSLHGLHLVVPDMEAARSDLLDRGVEVSEPFHFGPQGQTDGADPHRSDYATFASFSDPDGNSWLLQEVPSRATA